MGESAARPQVCRFRPLALLLAPPAQAVRGVLAPSQSPASSAPRPCPTAGLRFKRHQMAASSLLTLIDDIATLLDDVATMTKVAARQSAAAADDVAAMTQLAAKKTAGVLGDDLALNAQQV